MTCCIIQPEMNRRRIRLPHCLNHFHSRNKMSAWRFLCISSHNGNRGKTTQWIHRCALDPSGGGMTTFEWENESPTGNWIISCWNSFFALHYILYAYCVCVCELIIIEMTSFSFDPSGSGFLYIFKEKGYFRHDDRIFVIEVKYTVSLYNCMRKIWAIGQKVRFLFQRNF